MDFLDIIWIVVCIVLVAVPDLVFNNKKKKSARGRARTSGPMPQMPENFPMPPMPSVPSEPESMPESMPTDDEPEDFPVWTEPEVTEGQPEPQGQDVEQPKPVVEQPKPVIEQPKPVVVKEVSRRPASSAPKADSSPADDGKKDGKLRVDPRNLVIYTAIMEPKFKEM
ncbi:MAG: hypothetical protein UDS46_00910 [Bacteroidales bacterium]|nr:hypothetical protein [Bacteroidales bacterium]